jgi:predicted GH43/DUF377 family glycosyl hydrolase
MKQHVFFLIKCLLSMYICIHFPLNVHSQIQWTKYGSNPVISPGPSWFDAVAIGQPTVLYENDTIRMWYAGVAPDTVGRICYAWSTDGINWNKEGVVLDTGLPGQWDCGWMDTPEIIKDNNGYKMYYYGDSAWQFSAISSAMGVATSPDGINWTRFAGNPVLTKGTNGEWDDTWVESPALYFDSLTNTYMMWYNGMDTTTWKVQIGLATSSDGFNWIKYPGNPVITSGFWGTYDDMWLGTPAVLVNEGLFELWYAATSTNSYDTVFGRFDTLNICYATSTDGIIWTKHLNNPLFHTWTPPADSLTDMGGPWAPDVICRQNTSEYFMWYETQSGFGLAISPIVITNRENNQISSEIMIYPNPVEDHAVVSCNESFVNASVSIIDMNGRIIFAEETVCGKNFNIDARILTSGAYTLRVIDSGRIYDTKLIKL